MRRVVTFLLAAGLVFAVAAPALAAPPSSDPTRRRQEAGNGVSLWNAPDVTVAENSFRYGRDGIFTISSRKDRFINNRFEQVRFAVHYMYTNDSEVSGNLSIGNTV